MRWSRLFYRLFLLVFLPKSWLFAEQIEGTETPTSCQMSSCRSRLGPMPTMPFALTSSSIFNPFDSTDALLFPSASFKNPGTPTRFPMTSSYFRTNAVTPAISHFVTMTPSSVTIIMPISSKKFEQSFSTGFVTEIVQPTDILTLRISVVPIFSSSDASVDGFQSPISSSTEIPSVRNSKLTSSLFASFPAISSTTNVPRSAPAPPTLITASSLASFDSSGIVPSQTPAFFSSTNKVSPSELSTVEVTSSFTTVLSSKVVSGQTSDPSSFAMTVESPIAVATSSMAQMGSVSSSIPVRVTGTPDGEKLVSSSSVAPSFPAASATIIVPRSTPAPPTLITTSSLALFDPSETTAVFSSSFTHQVSPSELSSEGVTSSVTILLFSEVSSKRASPLSVTVESADLVTTSVSSSFSILGTGTLSPSGGVNLISTSFTPSLLAVSTPVPSSTPTLITSSSTSFDSSGIAPSQTTAVFSSHEVSTSELSVTSSFETFPSEVLSRQYSDLSSFPVTVISTDAVATSSMAQMGSVSPSIPVLDTGTPSGGSFAPSVPAVSGTVSRSTPARPTLVKRSSLTSSGIGLSEASASFSSSAKYEDSPTNLPANVATSHKSSIFSTASSPTLTSDMSSSSINIESTDRSVSVSSSLGPVELSTPIFETSPVRLSQPSSNIRERSTTLFTSRVFPLIFTTSVETTTLMSTFQFSQTRTASLRTQIPTPAVSSRLPVVDSSSHSLLPETTRKVTTTLTSFSSQITPSLVVVSSSISLEVSSSSMTVPSSAVLAMASMLSSLSIQRSVRASSVLSSEGLTSSVSVSELVSSVQLETLSQSPPTSATDISLFVSGFPFTISTFAVTSSSLSGTTSARDFRPPSLSLQTFSPSSRQTSVELTTSKATVSQIQRTSSVEESVSVSTQQSVLELSLLTSSLLHILSTKELIMVSNSKVPLVPTSEMPQAGTSISRGQVTISVSQGSFSSSSVQKPLSISTSLYLEPSTQELFATASRVGSVALSKASDTHTSTFLSTVQSSVLLQERTSVTQGTFSSSNKEQFFSISTSPVDLSTKAISQVESVSTSTITSNPTERFSSTSVLAGTTQTRTLVTEEKQFPSSTVEQPLSISTSPSPVDLDLSTFTASQVGSSSITERGPSASTEQFSTLSESFEILQTSTLVTKGTFSSSTVKQPLSVSTPSLDTIETTVQQTITSAASQVASTHTLRTSDSGPQLSIGKLSSTLSPSGTPQAASVVATSRFLSSTLSIDESSTQELFTVSTKSQVIMTSNIPETSTLNSTERFSSTSVLARTTQTRTLVTEEKQFPSSTVEQPLSISTSPVDFDLSTFTASQVGSASTSSITERGPSASTEQFSSFSESSEIVQTVQLTIGTFATSLAASTRASRIPDTSSLSSIGRLLSSLEPSGTSQANTLSRSSSRLFVDKSSTQGLFTFSTKAQVALTSKFPEVSTSSAIEQFLSTSKLVGTAQTRSLVTTEREFPSSTVEQPLSISTSPVDLDLSTFTASQVGSAPTSSITGRGPSASTEQFSESSEIVKTAVQKTIGTSAASQTASTRASRIPDTSSLSSIGKLLSTLEPSGTSQANTLSKSLSSRLFVDESSTQGLFTFSTKAQVVLTSKFPEVSTSSPIEQFLSTSKLVGTTQTRSPEREFPSSTVERLLSISSSPVDLDLPTKEIFATSQVGSVSSPTATESTEQFSSILESETLITFSPSSLGQPLSTSPVDTIEPTVQETIRPSAEVASTHTPRMSTLFGLLSTSENTRLSVTSRGFSSLTAEHVSISVSDIEASTKDLFTSPTAIPTVLFSTLTTKELSSSFQEEFLTSTAKQFSASLSILDAGTSTAVTQSLSFSVLSAETSATTGFVSSLGIKLSSATEVSSTAIFSVSVRPPGLSTSDSVQNPVTPTAPLTPSLVSAQIDTSTSATKSLANTFTSSVTFMASSALLTTKSLIKSTSSVKIPVTFTSAASSILDSSITPSSTQISTKAVERSSSSSTVFPPSRTLTSLSDRIAPSSTTSPLLLSERTGTSIATSLLTESFSSFKSVSGSGVSSLSASSIPFSSTVSLTGSHFVSSSVSDVARSQLVAGPTSTPGQLGSESVTAAPTIVTSAFPTHAVDTVTPTPVYNTTAITGMTIANYSVVPTNATLPSVRATLLANSTVKAPVNVTKSTVYPTERSRIGTPSVNVTEFSSSQIASLKLSATVTPTKHTVEVNATVSTPSSFPIVTVSVPTEPTSATAKTTDASTPNATDSLATMTVTTSESTTVTLLPTSLPTNATTVLPTNDTLIATNASYGSVKTTKFSATSFPINSVLPTRATVTTTSSFTSSVSTDKVTEPPTSTAVAGVTTKPPETTTLQPTRKPTEPFIPSVEYWAQIEFKLNFIDIHLNDLEWTNFIVSNIEKAYTEAKTLEQPASTQSQAAEQSKKRRRREDDKVIVTLINATTDGVAEGRAVVTFYIKDQREFVLAQRVTQLLKLHDATTINGIIGYEVVSVHPYGYLSTLRPSFTEDVIDDGFPLWAIVLVVVLAVCIVLLIFLIFCYCCWRAKYTDKVTILQSEERKEKLTEEGERLGIELKHYTDLLHDKAPPIEPIASWLGDEGETTEYGEDGSKIIIAPASPESEESSQYDVKKPLPDISDEVDISETQLTEPFSVEYSSFVEKEAFHPASSIEMAASLALFSHPLASSRRRLPSIPGHRPVSVSRTMEKSGGISAETQTSLVSSRKSSATDSVPAGQVEEDEKIQQLIALEEFQKKEEERQKEAEAIMIAQEAIMIAQTQRIEQKMRHKADLERWRNKQRHRERHSRMENERREKEDKIWRKSKEEKILEKQKREKKERKVAQKEFAQILDPEATQFEESTKKRMSSKPSQKSRRWKSTASVHPQLQLHSPEPAHQHVTLPAWQWQEPPIPSPRVLEVQPVPDQIPHSHPQLATEELRYQQAFQHPFHPPPLHRRRELPVVPAARPPARSTMSWTNFEAAQSVPILVQERAGTQLRSTVPPAVIQTNPFSSSPVVNAWEEGEGVLPPPPMAVQPSERYGQSGLTGVEQPVQVTPVYRSVNPQGNVAWNPYDNYRQSLDRLYSPSTFEVAQPASVGSLPTVRPPLPLQQQQSLPIQLGQRDVHVAASREKRPLQQQQQQPLLQAIRDELRRLNAAQQSDHRLL